jgi:hypothetical protein
MKIFTLFAIFFLLAPIIALAQETNTPEEYLLSKQKAGYCEIGMGIDNLLGKYGRESSKLVDLNLEGTFSPAIEFFFDNPETENPSLVAEIGWGSSQNGGPKGFIVSRITIYGKNFKTEKGIGVGSTLGELRKNHHINWIELGEGGLIARVDDLGMSFVLFLVTIPEEWLLTRNMELIPNEVTIISILIN